jgi:hypothetical protein
MFTLKPKLEYPETVPRDGDTLVTLTCDKSKPLDERMYLLSYAFAKAVQGSVLRQVVLFDLVNGRVQFIVGDTAAVRGLHGELHLALEEWDRKKHGCRIR